MLKIIDVNTIFGRWPIRRVDTSLERLIQLINKHKVTKAFSLSTKGIFYDYEEGNNETLTISQQNEKICPVATIDLRQWFGDKRKVEERVEQGFKLFRLFPEYQHGWPIEYTPFQRLIECLEEFEVPLMISCTSMGTATQIANIIKGKDIIVILSGVNTSASPLFPEVIMVAKEKPNIYIETHRFDSARAYEFFTKEVGADRLIYGSYAPLHYMASSLLSLERADIPDSSKELILSGNIERILEV